MLDCFTDEPAVINDFLEKNQGSREFTFDSIEFKHENNKGRIMIELPLPERERIPN